MGFAELIGGIVEAATAVLEAIAPALQKLLTVIANALLGFCKALNLLKPETQAQDLGDKAIQSGYEPEEFDSYGEYVKAVEDYDNLDPEKSKQISEDDKNRKAIELAAGVAIEKFEDLPIEDFFVEAENNPDFFTKDMMEKIGELIETEPQKLAEILCYINGTEKNNDKIESTIETLTGIVQEVDPAVSADDAFQKVLAARR